MVNEKIKNIYVWAVKNGLREIDDIPEAYRKLVKAEIGSKKKDSSE